jgi:glyoxylase-like metal-dependent hydrolase (beta-lactamase superfamily II)
MNQSSVSRVLIFSSFLLMLSAALPAQSPRAPFTEKDAERGLALAKSQWQVRKEILDLTAPDGTWGYRAQIEPFKMIGNLYSVGVGNGDSYLLTGPQGHILFGAGMDETADHVIASIKKLGFQPTDVKIILINHFHGNQVSGAVKLKAATGAKIMAGFGEVPWIENGGVPPGTQPAPGRGGAPPSASNRGQSGGPVGGVDQAPFGVFGATQLATMVPYPKVKVDRGLLSEDVLTVGPLKVTVYISPGHTATPISYLFNVREGGKNYRVFNACCWEFNEPGPYRNPFYSDAAVERTLELYRKVLPVDVYLEGGTYGWSGVLNQTSGTMGERLAKLKAEPGNVKLWVNRDLFPALAAAREVSYLQHKAKHDAEAK